MKASAVLTACFKALFFVVFGVLLIALCVAPMSTYPVQVDRQLVYTLVVLALGGGLLWLLSWWMRGMPALRAWLKRRFGLVAAVGIGALALWHVALVYQLYLPINWDVVVVVEAATMENPEVLGQYFSNYPHNLLLVLIYRWFLSLFQMSFVELVNLRWLFLSLLNVAAVDGAIVFAVVMARRAQGVRCGYLTLLVSLVLFAAFPWLIVPYTDTMSMPFVTGALCMACLMRRAERPWVRAVYAVAMGLLLAVGISIKVTVWIAMIAAAIVTLLRLPSEPRRVAREGLWLGVALVVCVAALAAINLGLQRQTVIPIDGQRAVPPAHFMAMGMSQTEVGYGAYNPGDVEYTLSFATTKEMDMANREKVRERLRDMGVGGYASFLLNKARWITSEGYFAWGLEGNFAAYPMREANMLTEFFFPEGRNFEKYLHVAQALWIVLLLLIVSRVGVDRLGMGSGYAMTLQLSCFGILLFVLLFEGRSRYLMNYLPVFAALGASSLDAILQKRYLLRQNASIGARKRQEKTEV